MSALLAKLLCYGNGRNRCRDGGPDDHINPEPWIIIGYIVAAMLGGAALLAIIIAIWNKCRQRRAAFVTAEFIPEQPQLTTNIVNNDPITTNIVNNDPITTIEEIV